jgi:type IV pilus assembly protein PilP
MYKQNLFISKLAFFLCFFILLGGCDNQADAPKVSQVVSKKIVIKKQGVSTPVPPKKVSTPKKQIAPKPSPSKPAIVVTTPVDPLKPTAKPTTVASENKEVQVALIPIAEKVTFAPQATVMKPVASAINYDTINKFDPFMPLYKDEPVAKAKKKKKKRRLPLTPLEKVDLSQLKLVGIIRAPSGDKALVQESSGKGYIVKKGTYIGIHAGRVIRVLKNKIVVEEEIETELGTYKLHERELKIHKPAGEL